MLLLHLVSDEYETLKKILTGIYNTIFKVNYWLNKRLIEAKYLELNSLNLTKNFVGVMVEITNNQSVVY